MKKSLILLTVVSLFLSSCSLKKDGPSALQISSNPKTTVYLDDKESGKTPFYDEKLKPGEYTLKLVPENSQYVTWEAKIKLNPDVLTVVNRDLGFSTEMSAGEILNLEKNPQGDPSDVSIVTTPNLANVKFDKQDQGQSPTLIKNTTPSDHEISISMPGYIDRSIKVKTVSGYKLNASIQLASITGSIPSPSNEPASSATPSAKATTAPKATSPVQTESPVVTDPNKVLILDTPTGWLRVRAEPSLNASESGKVNPGEKYPYISEQTGWVKIEYATDKEGWVSSQYIKKIKE